MSDLTKIIADHYGPKLRAAWGSQIREADLRGEILHGDGSPEFPGHNHEGLSNPSDCSICVTMGCPCLQHQ